MQSELRIDINQEVDVVRYNLGLEQDAARFFSNLAMICLSRRSTPMNSTWRRYFGPKTTWYLQEKAMLRLDLCSIQEYIANSNGLYNHQEGRAFLPMAKARDFARAFR
jgi:hypothetical protein